MLQNAMLGTVGNRNKLSGTFVQPTPPTSSFNIAPLMKQDEDIGEWGESYDNCVMKTMVNKVMRMITKTVKPDIITIQETKLAQTSRHPLFHSTPLLEQTDNTNRVEVSSHL